MTTVSGAYAVLRQRFEQQKPAGLAFLRWQNEDGEPLPDTPAPFAYAELLTDPAVLAGYGGGRGSNLFRNPGRLDIYVFVPRGQGFAVAADLAEECAAIFRSFRASDVDQPLSCFGASVLPGGSGADMKPPGLSSEVGNYFCAIAEVDLFYDQIG